MQADAFDEEHKRVSNRGTCSLRMLSDAIADLLFGEVIKVIWMDIVPFVAISRFLDLFLLEGLAFLVDNVREDRIDKHVGRVVDARGEGIIQEHFDDLVSLAFLE